MNLVQTATSGFLACSSFFLSQYFNEVSQIAKNLDDYPYRKTAYKIGILCLEAGFWGIGVINMAACSVCIHSTITNQALLPAASLILKAALASGALGLGLVVIGYPLMYYARLWELFK